MQARVVAKVMEVPLRSAFESYGLETSAVWEGRYLEGRGVDVNGSRNRVGVAGWAFRVGLNQKAGSLGGAVSPGYFRVE